MIKKLRAIPNPNVLKQRVARRWTFYALMGAFLLSLGIFLFLTLKTLFLPIICGAVLAYLFRPMKNFMRVPWMSDHLRIVLLFSAVFTAIFWASLGVKSLLPGELGVLELKIRMQYKFNEKLEELMDVNAITGEGNTIYEMLGSEVKPAVKHINELLALTPTESKEFIKFVNHHDKSERPHLQYIIYYNINEKFHKTPLAQPTDVAKLAALDTTRAPASTAETNSELVAKRKGAAVGGLLSALSTWFVMPLVFIFLMFDDGHILRFLLRLIPNRYFEVSMMVIKEFDEAVGRYLRGTILECGLVGLTVAVGLVIVGVSIPVAFLIGFAAAVTNVIPFLGHVFALGIGLSYALIAEDVSPLLPFMSADDLFVGVIVVVGITHVLDNVIFQPIVLGKAVSLHPLVVILSVVGGSLSFGFAGMLLAIPAIVIIKTVVETLFKELKAYRII